MFLFKKGKKIDEMATQICSGRKFSKNRMDEIRLGLKNGLSTEQVSFYANPEFTANQMREIRVGFENKLSMEKVMIFAKPEFGSVRMGNIRTGLEKGFDSWKIKLITDESFNDDQAGVIYEGLGMGLTEDQIMTYAKSEFHFEQMHMVLLGFQISLSLEKILLYAKPDLKLHCMVLAWEGFKEGLSIDEVNLYVRSELSKEQMEEIRAGFYAGLSIEKVRTFADATFTPVRMKEIRTGYENGLDIGQVSVYAKPEFECYQMQEIREGFERGLTMEQVRSYANPWTHYEDMKREKKRLLSESNLCSPILNFYLNGGMDNKGRTLEKMWGMGSVTLEMSHDYIQWLFPTNEESQHNSKAPILTEADIRGFYNSMLAKKNLINSLKVMLEFYGLELGVSSSGEPKISDSSDNNNFSRASKRWLTKNNHNYARFTRMLKSLRLCGLEEYANALYSCLKRIASEVDVISEETIKHWDNAMR